MAEAIDTDCQCRQSPCIEWLLPPIRCQYSYNIHKAIATNTFIHCKASPPTKEEGLACTCKDPVHDVRYTTLDLICAQASRSTLKSCMVIELGNEINVSVAYEAYFVSKIMKPENNNATC